MIIIIVACVEARQYVFEKGFTFFVPPFNSTCVTNKIQRLVIGVLALETQRSSGKTSGATLIRFK